MAASGDRLPSPISDDVADAFDECGLQHHLQTLVPTPNNGFDSVDPDLFLETLAPATDGSASPENDLSLSLETLEDLPFFWGLDAIIEAHSELSEEFECEGEEEAVAEDAFPDIGFTLGSSSDEFDELAEEIDSFDAPSFLVRLPELDGSLRGALPAAIPNLPSVVLTAEDVARNNSTCAVCKDDFIINQSVKKLPCSHYYHEECILPWLKFRSTCPVCRFELSAGNGVVPEEAGQVWL